MLLVVGTAAAQEWEEFVSKEDGFKVDFPGTPKVTDTTWKSQMDYVLPGKVYSVDKGRERYSMTVIDYRSLEQQGIERAKTCEARQRSSAARTPASWARGTGSTTSAARSCMRPFRLLQKATKVTSLAWEWQDMVEGNFAPVDQHRIESRTFAYVAMHENKLYMLEGTVPKGYPEPGLFQQSMGFVDEDGNGIRYQNIIYSNAYHGMGVYPKPSPGGNFQGPGQGRRQGQGQGAGGGRGQGAGGGRGQGGGAGAGAGQGTRR